LRAGWQGDRIDERFEAGDVNVFEAQGSWESVVAGRRLG
jgi:hypothetical protein